MSIPLGENGSWDFAANVSGGDQEETQAGENDVNV
jgi:hypothetical protein